MGKIVIVDSEVQRHSHKPSAGMEVNIAADISATKWVYCVRWDGQEQRRLVTPAALNHLEALIAQYEECRVRFTYEACGFGYEAAWLLQQHKVDVVVSAPSRMERTPGLQVKTDNIDVGKAARKLEQRDLKGIYIPTRVEHENRQLVRTYGQALKERKRAQTRIRSLMQEHGRSGPRPTAGWKNYREWLATQELPEPLQLSAEALLSMRTIADLQASRMKTAVLALVQQPSYQPVVEALCAQRGVGPFSAIRFVLEIMDITRFRTAESIGHYMGLTPSEYSSGSTVERGPVLKCGPGSLRAALLQCGWASCRANGDPELRAVFERLAPRTGKKRAIVAVTRRLVTRLRARWLEVLREQQSTPSA